MNLDIVLEDAKKVLEGNWTGNFTIPVCYTLPTPMELGFSIYSYGILIFQY